MSLHTGLDQLNEAIRSHAEKALQTMRSDAVLASLGVEGIAVSESIRELAVQMAYYSRGRMHYHGDVQAMYKAAGLYAIDASEAKRAATWTLDSKHLRGEALDLVPTREGKPWWNAPSEVWTRMGAIGEAHGLIWGGRWKNRDTPHFEV